MKSTFMDFGQLLRKELGHWKRRPILSNRTDLSTRLHHQLGQLLPMFRQDLISTSTWARTVFRYGPHSNLPTVEKMTRTMWGVPEKKGDSEDYPMMSYKRTWREGSALDVTSLVAQSMRNNLHWWCWKLRNQMYLNIDKKEVEEKSLYLFHKIMMVMTYKKTSELLGSSAGCACGLWFAPNILENWMEVVDEHK